MGSPRILAVDVGTGTQDVLLFEAGSLVENAVQLVMPSPTALIAERVRAATRARRPLALTGVTMGGGPSMWAVEDHLRAGLPVRATLPAAQSFDDDPEKLRALGIELVDEAEARGQPEAVHLELRDFYQAPIEAALRAFGVEPRLDAVAVAVFDHGAAPPEVSDRVFRFRYLAETLRRDNRLTALAYRRDEIPAAMTRLAAVAATVPAETPLVVMDTAPAAVLGALDDPVVRRADPRIVVNVGNFHSLAFHFERERVVGLLEHHTGELTTDQMVDYLTRLGSGQVTNQEVYDDKGHGAIVWPRERGAPRFYGVTGPRRGMLRGTALRPYFAVPHGDMMLAGCFGLLRAYAARDGGAREPIEARLGPPRSAAAA
jgi:uncharacterized protein (DUF1786 family)